MKAKFFILMSLFISSVALAQMDFKQKLLEAAKDKNNQDKAMELAKKGMAIFSGEKAAETASTTTATSN